MSAIKERILGAITVMSDTDAQKVWELILDNFSNHSWDDIEETEPDEFDIQMLKQIATDPECNEFVSADEVMKELGL